MQIIPVSDFDLVIFGATGDLANRKILPGLFHRFLEGQMTENSRIIGAARTETDHDGFRDMLRQSLLKYAPNESADSAAVEKFLEHVLYFPIDAMGEAGWADLHKCLRANVVRAFYLSVGPSIFGAIAERLVKSGCADRNSRIVVEKPFGHDLASAQKLNAELRASFEEDQIYRIDHYLGKETVQNLMAIRFANALFEPLWNSHHIDHVQITVSENLSVAGRGGYYDKSGAMRDMVQNHLMQLLCLVAMEPPSKFEADAVRDEKLKVIRALSPVPRRDIVRGQYRAGGGEGSYHEHAENPNSTTESFIALRVEVENWRWTGVPFYLRTGKRLRARASEIAVTFKEPPHSIFGKEMRLPANALIIRLQPDEGITLNMTIKEPGPGGMRLVEVPLDMTFAETLGEAAEFPDAYERLIMDVIRGNQTLFMRGDEVEAAWKWADDIIGKFSENALKPQPYDALSSGPEDALALLHRDGRRWREIE